MTIITYGDDVSFDTDKLPPISVAFLFQKAANHRFGNEVDSAVVGRVRSKDGLNDPKATTEAVKAWREANADTIASWAKAIRKEKLQELLDGKVGSAGGGPRLDPVEREYQLLLVREVTAVLKGAGLKMPKTDEEVLTFASGVTRTRAQMLANKEIEMGPALRKEAGQRVSEAIRRAKKAQDDAAKKSAAGPIDPAALGI